MDTKEFRKLVINSPAREWLTSVAVTVDYPAMGLKKTFEGLTALYKFLDHQVTAWTELGSDIPNELTSSTKHFSQSKSQLAQFLNARHQHDAKQVSQGWNQVQGSFTKVQNDILTGDSAEAKFLMSVHSKQPNLLSGAYHFIVGKSANYNAHNDFAGSLLAYEFRRSEYPKLKYRKLGEIESFNEMIEGFKKQLSDAESQLAIHLAGSKDTFENYIKKIDELKTDKENAFNSWYDDSRGLFSDFHEGSLKKIDELEDTYKTKLQLEKPALYWSTQASQHRLQGWWAFGFLALFVFIAIGVLGVLLWKPPSEIFVSFFEKDKSAAIRWSIIFITLISFMAYCIRAIAKVMFSSFHLSRDCQERHTLTYFYLALSKDQEVPQEERTLIMQSLFSRADTGLLKDDGSPTMPNDFAGKLIGK